MALTRRALLALPVASGVVSMSHAATPMPPRPGLRLWRRDEFDRATLDGGAIGWRTSFYNGKRALDREPQAYLDEGHPLGTVKVRDGMLSLRAVPSDDLKADHPWARFGSGMVSSHDTLRFRYGYIEARIRIPAGKGLWPAFWLFPGHDLPYGEIDVMEALGHEPGLAYAHVHAGPKWDGRKIHAFTSKRETPFSDDFHVYAVDWNERRTIFLIDGQPIGGLHTPEEIKVPMFVMLNLAMAGPWGPPPDADATGEMLVDWVRIWRYRH